MRTIWTVCSLFKDIHGVQHVRLRRGITDVYVDLPKDLLPSARLGDKFFRNDQRLQPLPRIDIEL